MNSHKLAVSNGISKPAVQEKRQSIARGKSRSLADSIRESDVPKQHSIQTSAAVAGARSEAKGNPHPPRNVRAWGREMASARRWENEEISC